MARLVSAEARRGHRLFVAFADGTAGEIDFRPKLFGPIFKPLADEALFAQVRIDEFGVPCWPNGADVAPDALYEDLRRSAPSSA